MDASRDRRTAHHGTEPRVPPLVVGKTSLVDCLGDWAALYGITVLGTNLETSEIVKGARPTMTPLEHCIAAAIGLALFLIAKFGFGL